MMNLCIAGVPMRIQSAHPEWAKERYAAYVREDDRSSLMDIYVRLEDEIACPEGTLVEKVKAATILQLPDGRHCRYSYDPEGRIFLATYYKDDYSEVEIHLLRSQNHPYFSNQEWEYSLTGFAFQDRLTVLGQGIIHASSLAWRGQGVAFSANSGTGKSTHVGLWRERFGDEVTVVNDDKPAIVFEEDKPMLCGTPWSGKTALNSNLKVPLRAIVFIERGAENSIRRLDVMDSYFYLCSQIARPYYDASVGEKMIEFAERLLATVPIYCLTCNISHEAVETVVNELFPEEEI